MNEGRALNRKDPTFFISEGVVKLNSEIWCSLSPGQTEIVWQTFEILLVKHSVRRFGHNANRCLTNMFCLRQAKHVFEHFQNVSKALTSKISKCLPNNFSLFGQRPFLELNKSYSCGKSDQNWKILLEYQAE